MSMRSTRSARKICHIISLIKPLATAGELRLTVLVFLDVVGAVALLEAVFEQQVAWAVRVDDTVSVV